MLEAGTAVCAYGDRLPQAAATALRSATAQRAHQVWISSTLGACWGCSRGRNVECNGCSG